VRMAPLAYPALPAVLVEAKTALSRCFVHLERYGDSEREAMAAIATCRSTPALAKSHQLAAALNALAFGLCKEKKYLRAEQAAEEALQISERKLGPSGVTVPAALAALADAVEGQAVAQWDKELREKMLDLRKRAHELEQSLHGEKHFRTAERQLELGRGIILTGRVADGEGVLRQGLSNYSKSLGATHPAVLDTRANLAVLLKVQGKTFEALSMDQALLKDLIANEGTEHIKVAAQHHQLGSSYVEQGMPTEAEPEFREALRIREKVHGQVHKEVASTLSRLADLASFRKDYEEAEKLMKRVLTIDREVLGKDSHQLWDDLGELMDLYTVQQRFDEAALTFQVLLEDWGKAFGKDSLQYSYGLRRLASIRFKQAKDAESISLLEQALAIVEKVQGVNHLRVGEITHTLAFAEYYRQGHEKTESYLRRTILLYKKWETDQHITPPALNIVLEDYSSIMGTMKAGEEVIRERLVKLKKGEDPGPWKPADPASAIGRI
jgi:tetratricopeptide (TPR) repeat protein